MWLFSTFFLRRYIENDDKYFMNNCEAMSMTTIEKYQVKPTNIGLYIIQAYI